MPAAADLRYPKPLRHELSEAQLEEVLLWCADAGASDIVFCPEDPVWMQRHGVWRRVTDTRVTDAEVQAVVNFTSGQSNRAGWVRSGHSMDYAFSVHVPGKRTVRQRFRVNATASIKGVYAVMRVLPRSLPLLSDMHLPEDLERALFPEAGLVVISGVMGSGKSTLLAAVLHRAALDRGVGRQILTLEEPVEFDFSGLPAEGRAAPITQSEVGCDVRDWAAGVRTLTRRKAEIVMVGECRDRETISSLLSTVEQGVTAYTTVHAQDVPQTLARITHLFPEDERSAALAVLCANSRLLVHQRLVPRADREGRTALREYLPVDENVRGRLYDLSMDGLVPGVRELVARFGRSLLEDAEERYAAGEIGRPTLEAVRREQAGPGSRTGAVAGAVAGTRTGSVAGAVAGAGTRGMPRQTGQTKQAGQPGQPEQPRQGDQARRQQGRPEQISQRPAGAVMTAPVTSTQPSAAHAPSGGLPGALPGGLPGTLSRVWPEAQGAPAVSPAAPGRQAAGTTEFPAAPRLAAQPPHSPEQPARSSVMGLDRPRPKAPDSRADDRRAAQVPLSGTLPGTGSWILCGTPGRAPGTGSDPRRTPGAEPEQPGTGLRVGPEAPGPQVTSFLQTACPPPELSAVRERAGQGPGEKPPATAQGRITGQTPDKSPDRPSDSALNNVLNNALNSSPDNAPERARGSAASRHEAIGLPSAPSARAPCPLPGSSVRPERAGQDPARHPSARAGWGAPAGHRRAAGSRSGQTFARAAGAGPAPNAPKPAGPPVRPPVHADDVGAGPGMR